MDLPVLVNSSKLQNSDFSCEFSRMATSLYSSRSLVWNYGYATER